MYPNLTYEHYSKELKLKSPCKNLETSEWLMIQAQSLPTSLKQWMNTTTMTPTTIWLEWCTHKPTFWENIEFKTWRMKNIMNGSS